MSEPQLGPGEIEVPHGRDRLGRAHQLRVDISIAISLAPVWLRRAISDKDVAKARSARIEFVERIAAAIERRFRVSWIGGADDDDNARPPDTASPLFGGPACEKQADCAAVDSDADTNIP